MLCEQTFDWSFGSSSDWCHGCFLTGTGSWCLPTCIFYVGRIPINSCASNFRPLKAKQTNPATQPLQEITCMTTWGLLLSLLFLFLVLAGPGQFFCNGDLLEVHPKSYLFECSGLLEFMSCCYLGCKSWLVTGHNVDRSLRSEVSSQSRLFHGGNLQDEYEYLVTAWKPSIEALFHLC